MMNGALSLHDHMSISFILLIYLSPTLSPDALLANGYRVCVGAVSSTLFSSSLHYSLGIYFCIKLLMIASAANE